MKNKLLLMSAFFISNFFKGEANLENLLELDKFSCLEVVKNVSYHELYNAFLKNQTKLFSEAEIEWLKDTFWWQEAGNILEIGSGNGSYLSLLAENFSDKKFVGIEVSKSFLEFSNNTYHQKNLNFYEGNAENFDPKLKSTADLILFRLTLQHLKNPLLGVKNAYEYLTSDGYLLIIDSFDDVKSTSHPIPSMDNALAMLAKLQENKGNGNRKISLEILQMLNDYDSYISQNFKLIYSNLDSEGNIVHYNVDYTKRHNKALFFKHCLLLLAFIEKNFGIKVDLSQAYDELKSYVEDANAWTSPGMHFLVLKKK